MNRDSKMYAVQVLNQALAADPEAMKALFSEDLSKRIPCNESLAEHPSIICRRPGGGLEQSTICFFGIINGILCQPGDQLRLTRNLDPDTGELVSFGLNEFRKRED